MNNIATLNLFADMPGTIAPLFVLVSFGVLLAFVVIAGVRQKQKEAQQQALRKEQYRRAAQKRADGNKLGGSQRTHSSGLQTKQSRPKAVPNASAANASHKNVPHVHSDGAIVSTVDGHTHADGEEEFYDASGGSLGDVSLEGCPDLNGVRVISHDLAYYASDATKDYSDIAKAIVLGEVLDNPRCKYPYALKK